MWRFIRYAPERDESGRCESQFRFDAAEVLAIMEKRLAELPAEQHGRYPGILEWLRQRDTARLDPVDVPAPWNGWFLNVAIGMMNRKLGQVWCGKCGELVPQDEISIDSGRRVFRDRAGTSMSGVVRRAQAADQGCHALFRQKEE
ncbi:MAG: hypothetical protein IPJ52_01915 [Rhodocyclaceae bacterium]|nr:hypothetical protein [Rhodocyclaceae bacterium]